MYFVWSLECSFSSTINYLNVDVQSVRICDFHFLLILRNVLVCDFLKFVYKIHLKKTKNCLHKLYMYTQLYKRIWVLINSNFVLMIHNKIILNTFNIVLFES